MNKLDLYTKLSEELRAAFVTAAELGRVDPCSSTAETRDLLRRALEVSADRAAHQRVVGGIPRPAAKLTVGDRLRELQAERARFPRPRRGGLAGLFGGRP